MTQMNVITAGPSCGKSSIIRELSARGFFTLPESARMFINQKISEGVDSDKVREKYDFQKRLIEINETMENNIQNHNIAFLDRSLVDIISYMRYNGNKPSKELINKCRGRYDNIFILERLNFEDDKVREENEKQAQEIHDELRNTYIDLNYSIHEIPVIPIDKRADKILNILDLKTKSPYTVSKD